MGFKLGNIDDMLKLTYIMGDLKMKTARRRSSFSEIFEVIMFDTLSSE